MKLAATALATLAALSGVLALRAHAHHIPTTPARPAGQAPPTMLWAWEEPEDLRTLDPRHAGVAFLAERVFLGQSATSIPRHQPIRLAPGTYVAAVVRLETTRTFADAPELRAETAAAILRAAALPNIQGLQIDFDAVSSQRLFYADILRRVRAQLPPNVELTITALVSWCSPERSWLATVPVDAAVPMFFRLGQHVGTWQVQQPICDTTLGLSIDELQSAPATPRAGQRLYLFDPHPWTAAELTAINHDQIPHAIPGAR